MRPIAPRRLPASTVALVLVASAAAIGQGVPPAPPADPTAGLSSTRSRSEVRDAAKIFSPEAVREAQRILERVEKDTQVPVTIETVESLQGQAVNDAALERARQGGGQGVYLLISKRDQAIARPLIRRAFEDRLPEERRAAIRDAIVREFNRRQFDAGLRSGVDLIATALRAGSRTAPAPAPAPATTGTAPASAAEGGGSPPLFVRNQVHLTLAGARRALAAAEAKAAAMNLKVNIAVVDDGGHLIAFGRMDGARPASVATAITKATTAATYRQATGPVSTGSGPPDPLLNLSLQNAAAASGGKITTLYGGVPIVVEGQVVGAVGVGGGSGEQDAEVARAGVSAVAEGVHTEGGGRPAEPRRSPGDPAPVEPRTDRPGS